MRIVSLVPAGTEIAWALGLAEALVAVTHDCDFPAQVRELPRVTRSTIPAGTRSREIDALVRAAAQRHESTFHLDAEALRAARPEAILGQTICEVCAVTLAQLPSSLAPEPRVVPLDGESLAGVLADIRRAAEALGVRDRGEAVVRRLESRLAAVARRVRGEPRPRVACLEWLDPPYSGGHWVPEQVALAGGEDVLGSPGWRSREISWGELVGAGADVLVLMPCGFGVERALEEAVPLADRPGWAELPAVRSGRVFAVDGAAHFSRPGPRLVDGVEVLAALFHPERFPAPGPASARILGTRN